MKNEKYVAIVIGEKGIGKRMTMGKEETKKFIFDLMTGPTTPKAITFTFLLKESEIIGSELTLGVWKEAENEFRDINLPISSINEMGWESKGVKLIRMEKKDIISTIRVKKGNKKSIYPLLMK